MHAEEASAGSRCGLFFAKKFIFYAKKQNLLPRPIVMTGYTPLQKQMKKTTYTMTSLALLIGLIASVTLTTACQQDTNPSANSSETDSIVPYPVYRPLRGKAGKELAPYYYRQGKALHTNYYLLSASDYYQLAEQYAGDNPALLFRIHIEQAKISRFKMQRQEEDRYLNLAFDIAQTQHNDSLLSEAYYQKALAEIERHNFTSGKEYLQQALAHEHNPAMTAVYEQEISRLHLLCREADSALIYIRRSMLHPTPPEKLPQLQLLKGQIFLLAGVKDSARQLLTQSIDRLPLSKQAEAYQGLAHLEELNQRPAQALAYLKQYASLKDSLAADRKEEILEKIHGLQEYKLQRERAEKAEAEKTRNEVMLYRIVLLALLLLAVLYYIFYKTKQHKKQLILQLQAEKLQKMEVEIALVREQEKRKQQEIEGLNRTVCYYKQLNAITLPMLMSKRNSQGALHLNQEECDIIVQNTNACFDRFTERLKASYPQLTEDERLFCCLVKMELPLALLAEIYHIAKGSISRKKMRLKEKMQITDVSFDEFIAAF